MRVYNGKDIQSIAFMLTPLYLFRIYIIFHIYISSQIKNYSAFYAVIEEKVKHAASSCEQQVR